MTTEERDYLINNVGCKLEKKSPMFPRYKGEEYEVLTFKGYIVVNPDCFTFTEAVEKIKDLILNKIV